MTEKKQTLPSSIPVPAHTSGGSITHSPQDLSFIDLTTPADVRRGDDESPSSPAEKPHKLQDNQGWVEGHSIQDMIVDTRLIEDVPSSSAKREPSSTSADSDPNKSGASGKRVASKVGSLDNAKHRPGGGAVNNEMHQGWMMSEEVEEIVSHKMDFSNVKSKCGSMENAKHKPTGGAKKIETVKLEWQASSKIGSLDNAAHKPGGGAVKNEMHQEWMTSEVEEIEQTKLDFKEKAQPKIGSKDNMSHKPKGGDKKEPDWDEAASSHKN